MESPRALPSRGLVSSRCIISIDTGHVAHSPQSGPRWSLFCFLLQCHRAVVKIQSSDSERSVFRPQQPHLRRFGPKRGCILFGLQFWGQRGQLCGSRCAQGPNAEAAKGQSGAALAKPSVLAHTRRLHRRTTGWWWPAQPSPFWKWEPRLGAANTEITIKYLV